MTIGTTAAIKDSKFLDKVYMHPVESSFDAYCIIQKLNLLKDQQLKIYELIKTHNWLQQLNNAEKDMVENIAQDIAFDTRHTNTFELAKILREADMKSVKKETKSCILMNSMMTFLNTVLYQVQRNQTGRLWFMRWNILNK